MCLLNLPPTCIKTCDISPMPHDLDVDIFGLTAELHPSKLGLSKGTPNLFRLVGLSSRFAILEVEL